MTATFYVGDALEVMEKLPEKSVDLVLSSPPFLALRSYLPADHPDKSKEGGSQATPGEYIDWLVDVAEACARVLAPHGSLCFELGDTYAGSGGAGGDYDPEKWRQGQPAFDGSSKMARVRKSDAPHNPYPINPDNTIATSGSGWPLPKSLSLIPELFRLTLVYGVNPLTGRQTDRWRLRNVIRWVRPNPPVGALGDKFRPATSELMVFCKSAKRYFDLDAVREPLGPPGGSANRDGKIKKQHGEGIPSTDDRGFHIHTGNPAGAPPLDWWEVSLPEANEDAIARAAKALEVHLPEDVKAYSYSFVESVIAALRSTDNAPVQTGLGPSRGESEFPTHPLGAPPLDWWNIPPGGYEGAHYAVFPPELCVKPIKAMCPESVCRTCGEPRRRITEKTEEYAAFRERQLGFVAGGVLSERDQTVTTRGGIRNARREAPVGLPSKMDAEYLTLGFSDCGHDNYRPGLVLDPFAGSGTTLAVATGHGREAIGIDLDERNWTLALERVGPMLLERREVEV